MLKCGDDFDHRPNPTHIVELLDLLLPLDALLDPLLLVVRNRLHLGSHLLHLEEEGRVQIGFSFKGLWSLG